MKRLLLISLLIIGCSSNNSMGPEDDCDCGLEIRSPLPISDNIYQLEYNQKLKDEEQLRNQNSKLQNKLNSLQKILNLFRSGQKQGKYVVVKLNKPLFLPQLHEITGSKS